MPFCTQCGSQVGDADVYCAVCGSSQAGAKNRPSSPPPPSPTSDVLRDMDARRASFFCYIPIVGWVFAIVVLASERFRQDRIVRFHAFQGLYLFVLWLFVEWVFSPIAEYSRFSHDIGGLLKLAVIGAWIFMMVKTKQGEDFRLPFLGELAERSAAEQK